MTVADLIALLQAQDPTAKVKHADICHIMQPWDTRHVTHIASCDIGGVQRHEGIVYITREGK